MRQEFTIRIATADDIDSVLAHLSAGFESYREFAPSGWKPPAPDRERTLERFEQPDTWARLALADDQPVGHVAFTAATGDPFGDPDGWRSGPAIPGTAHLWQLFILPGHWGNGVGAALHDVAVAAMAEQGYERARLFTPVAHARARRFYERRGWDAGGSLPDPDLGLELVEYGRDLTR